MTNITLLLQLEKMKFKKGALGIVVFLIVSPLFLLFQEEIGFALLCVALLLWSNGICRFDRLSRIFYEQLPITQNHFILSQLLVTLVGWLYVSVVLVISCFTFDLISLPYLSFTLIATSILISFGQPFHYFTTEDVAQYMANGVKIIITIIVSMIYRNTGWIVENSFLHNGWFVFFISFGILIGSIVITLRTFKREEWF
ncbi:MAG: hypothetical protein ACRCWQ_14460 [Bacilli bacterium]